VRFVENGCHGTRGNVCEKKRVMACVVVCIYSIVVSPRLKWTDKYVLGLHWNMQQRISLSVMSCFTSCQIRTCFILLPAYHSLCPPL
jgi:hypothetical protein